jgi:hypothetical protein
MCEGHARLGARPARIARRRRRQLDLPQPQMCFHLCSACEAPQVFTIGHTGLGVSNPYLPTTLALPWQGMCVHRELTFTTYLQQHLQRNAWFRIA